jgi:predicted fused transcriptional regulator/phosphomethylpyrimidine kinase
VYTSKPAPGLSASNVQTIVAAARTRNEAIGFTGRLLHLSGHFVQVLEGRHADVAAVFGRISRDVRHHSIAVALNQRDSS